MSLFDTFVELVGSVFFGLRSALQYATFFAVIVLFPASFIRALRPLVAVPLLVLGGLIGFGAYVYCFLLTASYVGFFWTVVAIITGVGTFIVAFIGSVMVGDFGLLFEIGLLGVIAFVCVARASMVMGE